MSQQPFEVSGSFTTGYGNFSGGVGLPGEDDITNSGDVGSLYLRTNGELYQKIADGAGSDKWGKYGESIKSTGIISSSVIDEVPTYTYFHCQWILSIQDTTNRENNIHTNVSAGHNGFTGTDATEVYYSIYPRLDMGIPIAGLQIVVGLTGSGADQMMQLTVQSTGGVDVTADRVATRALLYPLQPSKSPDFETILSGEAITAGDMLNFYNDGGTLKTRRATANGITHVAHAFSKNDYPSGATVNAYVRGKNDVLSGLAIGERCFLSTTLGGVTTTPVTGANRILQPIGYALSTTTMMFERQPLILLAS